MSRADGDLLDTVVERLYRLRRACGSRVFRDAVDRALVAIGRSALEEAERRATSMHMGSATILRFPTGRRRRECDEE
jgi:hypothetical protein